MLRLLELVLALIVHSSVRRLVKIANNLAGVLSSIFHLMLFVSSCVIYVVMSLLCFVIFTVRRDIHVVALLLQLRPSFICDQFILCIFLEKGLGCWGDLIVFALVQVWMLLLHFFTKLNWIHVVSFSNVLTAFNHWKLVLIRVTSEPMLLAHQIGKFFGFSKLVILLFI